MRQLLRHNQTSSQGPWWLKMTATSRRATTCWSLCQNWSMGEARTVVPHTTFLHGHSTLKPPFPPIDVSCRAACIHCSNGINDESCCFAAVTGDNNTIVDTIVDDGVPSPDNAMHVILNTLS
uniref:Uncharacterized protein n=1 Tax=Proboscia inermis TaxID=420281 RepID=A0A6T8LZE2_9STRA